MTFQFILNITWIKKKIYIKCNKKPLTHIFLILLCYRTTMLHFIIDSEKLLHLYIWTKDTAACKLYSISPHPKVGSENIESIVVERIISSFSSSGCKLKTHFDLRDVHGERIFYILSPWIIKSPQYPVRVDFAAASSSLWLRCSSILMQNASKQRFFAF